MATIEEIARLIATRSNKCFTKGCKEEIYDIESCYQNGVLFQITGNLDVVKIDVNNDEEMDFQSCALGCNEHYSSLNLSSIDELYGNLINEFNLTADDAAVNADKEEIAKIEKEVLRALQFKFPNKKEYKMLESYIPRDVISINETYKSWMKYPELNKLVDSEKRVVLLGVAGMGKSVELERLSSVLSGAESKYYPVLIRLADVTNESVEELLFKEYAEWKNIPLSRLVILIDALDEVGLADFTTIVKKLNRFCDENEAIRVVVSCRNNFYTTELQGGGAKLKKFRTYHLTPIDYFTIRKYLSDHIDNVDSVLLSLQTNRYFELMESPFYLVRLADYYKEKKKFPESRKDLFEYLIKIRFEKDRTKYVNADLDLEMHLVEVRQVLEKIAVLMLCTGRNYITNDEVRSTIPTEEVFNQAIKRSFLFDKSILNPDHWEFEHNQFKEFLAASFLSRRTFKEIKKLAQIDARYQKIKPHWLNTMILLISILDVHDEKTSSILKWIIKSDPESLVRVERDKLELCHRESIFISIIQKYQAKNVLIRNGKFTLLDLVTLVYDSPKTLDFLIRRLALSESNMQLTESLGLIQGFKDELLESKKEDIEREVVSILERKDAHYNVVYECLNTLGELKPNNVKFTETLIGLIDLESSSHARTGLYEYLDKSDHLEYFVEVALSGLLRLERVKLESENDLEEPEPLLSLEAHILEGLIKKIETESGLKKIINWAFNNVPGRHYDGSTGSYFSAIEAALKTAANTSLQSDFEFCELVAKLTFKFAKKFYTHGEVNFYHFFENCPHSLQLFKFYADQAERTLDSEIDFHYTCGYVCNLDCVDYLLGIIQSEKLEDQVVFRLRWLLNLNADKPIFDRFYKGLIRINAKYAFPEVQDPKKLNAERIRRDCQLLHSKYEIISEAKDIFNSDQTSVLTSKVLWESEKHIRREDKSKNTLVYLMLRALAGDQGDVTIEKLIGFLEDPARWEWYRIQFLYNTDVNNTDFSFDDISKRFIEKWVENQLNDCNFTNAVRKKNDGKINYLLKELFVCYFIFRLNISISEELWIDLLNYPSSFISKKISSVNDFDENFSLLDEATKQLGKEKVNEHILANIQNHKIFDVTRKDFLVYAGNEGFTEAEEELLKEIQGTKYQTFEKREFINSYILGGGSTGRLSELISKVQYEVKLEILNALISSMDTNQLGQIIISLIESNDIPEQRYELIRRLRALDRSTYFKYMISWIKENRKFPDRNVFEELESNQLNDLMFLFQDSLVKKYGNNAKGHFYDRNDCIEPMIGIAAKSKEGYEALRYNFIKWFDFGSETKFLHYKLQDLEERYYLNTTVIQDFSNAQELIDDIIPTTRWEKFWNPKPKIEKLTYVVCTIILGLFGLIQLTIFLVSLVD